MISYTSIVRRRYNQSWTVGNDYSARFPVNSSGEGSPGPANVLKRIIADLIELSWRVYILIYNRFYIFYFLFFKDLIHIKP